MELLGKIVFHGPAAALRDFLCCCTELNRLLPGSNGPSCAPPRAEKDVIFRRVGDGGEEQRTVEAAVRGLGMEWGEGEGAMGAVEELLAEKEASEWELEEAFYVFDRNEDGFITAEEVWNVMRRLGFEEGRRLEDCERMIRAFDEDGDGKISFLEFRRMMENAI